MAHLHCPDLLHPAAFTQDQLTLGMTQVSHGM